MRVFVSYTLRDSVINRQVLTDIERALSGIAAPYIDLLHNRGPNHQAAVFAALRESSLVLACITPGYLHSPWVKLELATARHRGTSVVPLEVYRSRQGSQTYLGFRASSWRMPWPVQTPPVQNRGPRTASRTRVGGWVFGVPRGDTAPGIELVGGSPGRPPIAGEITPSQSS
jgi:hypothetical protein